MVPLGSQSMGRMPASISSGQWATRNVTASRTRRAPSLCRRQMGAAFGTLLWRPGAVGERLTAGRLLGTALGEHTEQGLMVPLAHAGMEHSLS
jgi:hypothetical protein